MKLELYYYEQCPFCLFVLQKIKQLGLEKAIIYKNVLENQEYRNEHLKITGRTTVPCLYIDDSPMFESRDIMAWLEQYKNSNQGES